MKRLEKKLIKSYDGGKKPAGIDIDNVNKKIFVTNAESNSISVINLKKNTIKESLLDYQVNVWLKDPIHKISGVEDNLYDRSDRNRRSNPFSKSVRRRRAVLT